MPTVAELIVEGLLRAEVPRLFGVPGGGSNLEVLEAARARGLPFVLCHQEWAATIMAAVTGELTGRPGAVLSTLGPGVTASATGLAHAQLDRSPLLYISDRHPAGVLAYATHQYLDHAAHLGPIVKGSVTVTPDSAGHWVAHAVQLALAEPRGPVHLDLPADVAGAAAVPVATAMTPPAAPTPDDALVERAAEMIRVAKRPLVIAGLGCRARRRQVAARVLRGAARAGADHLQGQGRDPRPASAGDGDLHGRGAGGAAGAAGGPHHHLRPRHGGADPAPLVLHRAGAEPRARALERAAPDARRAAAPTSRPRSRWSATWARSSRTWPRASCAGTSRRTGTWPRWTASAASARAALEVPVPGLAPHRVAQIARELTAAGSIATVDAGAHMFQTTTYWHSLEPGELLISNGLATMGFALPAAIAAQLVHPDRRVVCFTGDGGLMMVASELETVARLRLPIVIVVFNDAALSLIEVKQEQKGFEGVSMRYAGPDLVALGRAFGIRALAATSEATLQSALIAAQTAPGPTLIDARIDPSGYRKMLEIVRGAPK